MLFIGQQNKKKIYKEKVKSFIDQQILNWSDYMRVNRFWFKSIFTLLTLWNTIDDNLDKIKKPTNKKAEHNIWINLYYGNGIFIFVFVFVSVFILNSHGIWKATMISYFEVANHLSRYLNLNVNDFFFGTKRCFFSNIMMTQ